MELEEQQMNENVETLLRPDVALERLRDAELAQDLARFYLGQKLQDAFPAEEMMVKKAERMVARCKDDLIAAIGAYGPLPAEAKNPVGWAHYSSTAKREYAPLSQWVAALEAAGLQVLVPGIIMESLNIGAIEQLIASSGQFHQAVEKLVTEKLSKPALRYKWNAPVKPKE